MATITEGMVNWKVNGISVNTSIPSSSSNYNNCSSRNVSFVVMHYTGNTKDTAKANATYFKNGSRSASAHFFVGSKNIYQSVELRDIAWHCGCPQGYKTVCMNNNSIGIEMCTAGNYKVSAKTKKNAAYLCAKLCQLIGIKYNEVDKYVLRHYDVVKSNKKCPAQFVDNTKEWTEFKTWVSNILRYGNLDGLGSSTTTANRSSSTAKSSASTTKSTIPTTAKPTIQNKSKGTQVKYLQQDLNYLGFKGADGKKLDMDGNAGTNTVYAIKQFQKKYSLSADGIYGEKSYARMKTLLK